MSAQQKSGHGDHADDIDNIGQRVLHREDMSPTQVAEAYRAATLEHQMGFWQALRIYKKGMFWSVVMSVVGAELHTSDLQRELNVPGHYYGIVRHNAGR